MWIRKDKYYITCGIWTICKYPEPVVKYGLWNGNDNFGYFDNLELAKLKHSELIKCLT